MKKTIIITGAAGNLGRAAVKRFLESGYQIIAAINKGSKPNMDENHAGVEFQAVDLTDEEDVRKFGGEMISKYKTIDGGLMLAGGYAGGTVAETTGADLYKMYKLNFETAYFISRFLFEQMKQQETGGRLVFVGSRPAIHPQSAAKNAAYSLSKSLLFRLAEILNAEGANKNVISSVIVPSIIDTPQNRKEMPDAPFEDWVTPETLADIMEFICSQKADALREPVFKIYGNS